MKGTRRFTWVLVLLSLSILDMEMACWSRFKRCSSYGMEANFILILLKPRNVSRANYVDYANLFLKNLSLARLLSPR